MDTDLCLLNLIVLWWKFQVKNLGGTDRQCEWLRYRQVVRLSMTVACFIVFVFFFFFVYKEFEDFNFFFLLFNLCCWLVRTMDFLLSCVFSGNKSAMHRLSVCVLNLTAWSLRTLVVHECCVFILVKFDCVVLKIAN